MGDTVCVHGGNRSDLTFWEWNFRKTLNLPTRRVSRLEGNTKSIYLIYYVLGIEESITFFTRVNKSIFLILTLIRRHNYKGRGGVRDLFPNCVSLPKWPQIARAG